MAHELTLALATPIEDLVPKMIAFNNTERSEEHTSELQSPS